MKVLFIGNSLLGSIYRMYLEDNEILGKKVECSFVIDIGGFGPAVSIVDNKIIPSTRGDKEIYPDVYQPYNVLEAPINQYDAICIVALGSLGNPIEKFKSLMTYGQIFDFEPISNDISNDPIDKHSYSQICMDWFNAQSGFLLLDMLKHFGGQKIIIEQPLFNELLFQDPEWGLRKIYNNPKDALKFFYEKRTVFLNQKRLEKNITLIEAPFKEKGFTPKEYQGWNGDYLHYNTDYAKNLLENLAVKISLK